MEIRILHDVYWTTEDGLSGTDQTRVCLLEDGKYMEVALDTKDEQQIQKDIEKIKDFFHIKMKQFEKSKNRKNTKVLTNKN